MTGWIVAWWGKCFQPLYPAIQWTLRSKFSMLPSAGWFLFMTVLMSFLKPNICRSATGLNDKSICAIESISKSTNCQSLFMYKFFKVIYLKLHTPREERLEEAQIMGSITTSHWQHKHCLQSDKFMEPTDNLFNFSLVGMPDSNSKYASKRYYEHNFIFNWTHTILHWTPSPKATPPSSPLPQKRGVTELEQALWLW